MCFTGLRVESLERATVLVFCYSGAYVSNPLILQFCWPLFYVLMKNINEKKILLHLYFNCVVYFICGPRRFLFAQCSLDKPKGWALMQYTICSTASSLRSSAFLQGSPSVWVTLWAIDSLMVTFSSQLTRVISAADTFCFGIAPWWEQHTFCVHHFITSIAQFYTIVIMRKNVAKDKMK